MYSWKSILPFFFTLPLLSHCACSETMKRRGIELEKKNPATQQKIIKKKKKTKPNSTRPRSAWCKVFFFLLLSENFIPCFVGDKNSVELQ